MCCHVVSEASVAVGAAAAGTCTCCGVFAVECARARVRVCTRTPLIIYSSPSAVKVLSIPIDANSSTSSPFWCIWIKISHPPRKFSLEVHLRNRWPVRVLFNATTKLFVFKNVVCSPAIRRGSRGWLLVVVHCTASMNMESRQNMRSIARKRRVAT